MAETHTITVDVVSAEEQIFAGEAEFVVLPGVDGELGIYPRHTPLFTQIKPGAVRIKVPGQANEELVFVQGGFLEVQPHKVTVLADTAIRAHDLDEVKAMEAKKRAEEAMTNKESDESMASAQAELSAALAQLEAIRKFRNRA
jgi:F-type H+-transporting ATPase subunit epsilon